MSKLTVFLLWYQPPIKPFDRLTSDLNPYIVSGHLNLEKAQAAGLYESDQEGAWELDPRGIWNLVVPDIELKQSGEGELAYYTIESLAIN